MATNRENGAAKDFLGLGATARPNPSLDSSMSSSTSAPASIASDSAAPQFAKPGSVKENVYLTNMSMQWPYSNKAAALQQFISFKSLQDGSKNSYEKLSGFPSISTADAFGLNKNQPCVQTSFRLDPTGRNSTDGGQYHGQYSALTRHIGLPCAHSTQAHDERISPGYNFSKTGNIFPCSNRLFSIPNLVSPAYFKGDHAIATTMSVPTASQLQSFPEQNGFSLPVMDASSTHPIGAGTLPEKQTTAQLTIFYAGSVHVYDNVAADKAQALMFLAGNQSSISGKAGNAQSETSTMPNPVAVGGHLSQTLVTQSIPSTPILMSSTLPKVQPCDSVQGRVVPISQRVPLVTSAEAAQVNQRTEGASNAPISQKPNVDATRTAPLAPRVPIARKASLARFLEKRKERASTAAPYSLKKPTEDSSNAEKSPISPVESRSTPEQGSGPNKFNELRLGSLPEGKKDNQEQQWSLKAVKKEIQECD